MMKVTVVLPTLNEEDGIGETIDAIRFDEFKKRGWTINVVIIDGDSKDKTCEIAESKGAKSIIEKRKGYGRAYKTGFASVDADIIVTGDADGTYPFDKIHEYIDILLDKNLDFITTDRFADLGDNSMSWKHHLGNFILSVTLRLLFRVNVRDSQSGMWVFRRSILDKIKPLEKFDDGMPFSEEIKIEMFRNKNIIADELPSCLYQRKGIAKIQSWQDGWKNFKFLIKFRLTG
jgi:glycosyltransferase involved in cell wall biosynthesis